MRQGIIAKSNIPHTPRLRIPFRSVEKLDSLSFPLLPCPPILPSRVHRNMSGAQELA